LTENAATPAPNKNHMPTGFVKQPNFAQLEHKKQSGDSERSSGHHQSAKQLIHVWRS
jgi:hypothetical protein